MSTELIKARSKLGQVKTFLKQSKFIPALHSLREALVIILKNPLMRHEKEEFARLLDSAVHQIDSNQEFRTLVPLKMEYAPGSEKELLGVLNDILSDLESSAVDEARDQLAELEAKRQKGLDKGQEMLDRRQYDEAGRHFSELAREFANDPDLTATIGEKFLKAGRYEEAFEYLAQALEDAPESIHLYNSVGMALRKLGKFDTAEKYYAKALEFSSGDSNLYFNIGRLYLDWRKWDKVELMAQQALKYKPDFVEAQKMLAFARKKFLEKG